MAEGRGMSLERSRAVTVAAVCWERWAASALHGEAVLGAAVLRPQGCSGY